MVDEDSSLSGSISPKSNKSLPKRNSIKSRNSMKWKSNHGDRKSKCQSGSPNSKNSSEISLVSLIAPARRDSDLTYKTNKNI